MIPDTLLITELAFSDEFKAACALHGIANLGQLIGSPIESIYNISWLTAPMVEEFFAVIDDLKEHEKYITTDPGATDFVL